NNKDLIKKRKKEYDIKNKDKSKKYYQDNKVRIKEYEEANKDRIKEYKKECPTKPFKIQAVVCGRIQFEIMMCFVDYLNNPDIDVIAFSRRGQCFENECHDTARFRMVEQAVEYMHTNNISKPIHLLGANGIKDYYRDWPPEVRSIDSKQFANAVMGEWKLYDKATLKQKWIFKNIIKTI
ncbi:MAG: hypothetical protein QQN41_12460, partial [Nitrosopumilus sp.]